MAVPASLLRHYGSSRKRSEAECCKQVAEDLRRSAGTHHGLASGMLAAYRSQESMYASFRKKSSRDLKKLPLTKAPRQFRKQSGDKRPGRGFFRPRGERRSRRLLFHRHYRQMNAAVYISELTSECTSNPSAPGEKTVPRKCSGTSDSAAVFHARR